MILYIDGDALPNLLKPIIIRSVDRLSINTVVVSNKSVKVGRSELFSYILVGQGPDEADNRIAEMVCEGDLVITSDIPLADRVITKKAYAIDHRGKFFDAGNIKVHLSLRNFMQDVRDSGEVTKGPAPFTRKDAHEFANRFNNYLSGLHVR